MLPASAQCATCPKQTLSATCARFPGNTCLQRPEAAACGVYVGVSFEDYGRLASEAMGVTAYTATGTTASVVSGRISYSFGLRGPALTIDTGEWGTEWG
jgi:acyl transferase domain-containing protein